jgi:signal transduction histidine kinase
MTILRNMTIRHKLTTVIMLTCISALLLAGISLVAWGQFTFRRNMVRNLSTLAQVTADNCKAAIAFEDVDDATETLKALSAQPSIILAEVHTKTGEHFADYYRQGADSLVLIEHHKDDHHFGHGFLAVCKAIVLENETIGTVYLQSDLEPLHAMLRRNTIIIAAVLLFASLVAYLVSSRLQRVISKPILSLVEVARMVSDQKNYSARVQNESNDEVGLLVTAFNEMLEQIQQHQVALVDANEQLEARVRRRTAELERTHRKLIDTSRQAGMAEVATDVLHNVGNVLNSINVAATLIREKASNSEVSNLQKVAEIITEHTDDIGTFLTEDQQGRHIPAFLTEVSKALVEEQADTTDKLRSLAENIEHIKEIVKMQQSYAKISGVEVSASLTELVENAIQINTAALERHGIRLICDFDDIGPVSIDKQKVLQILVNLINNAKYAMSMNDDGNKILTIRIYKHGTDKIRIDVIDNGVGILQENLTKIFTHGFTTKKEGHGFGLHSGALTAKELGGSLMVHSDGTGHGATFTLELPFKPVKVTQ